MTPEPISTKSPRIHSVDALRGFAVMAILIVHNLEHFIFPVYPTDSPGWLETIDKYVFDTVFFLFAGKAYAIFALLFGFTYYIQYRNQQARGGNFSGRFMWRLLLLAGFACINAAFFPAGDVLLLFSVVGGILVLMRRQSDRCILAVAILLLMQPVEWIYLLSYLFVPGFHAPDLNVGQMYSDVAAVTRSGNFADFILCNITLGQKASFLWAVNAGRLTQTAGLFLLGFHLGRRQLFVQSDKSLAFWKRLLVIAAIAFIPLYALHSYLSSSPEGAGAILSTISEMWRNLAFTFVLIAGFVILFYRTSLSRHSGALQLYGKMSLTNYITQSIFGALIYFPFGLYLAPRCGYTASLAIGLLVFALQITFSRWWLARHRQGPLESLWHKLTWLRK